jgi:hypothetical protein
MDMLISSITQSRRLYPVVLTSQADMATRRPLVESKRDNNVEQVVYAQREESKVSAGESIRNGLNKKSISDLKRDVSCRFPRLYDTR